jgi:hypothetical protein
LVSISIARDLEKIFDFHRVYMGIEGTEANFLLLVCVRSESLATRNRNLYTKFSVYTNPRARAKSGFASVYYVLGNSFTYT